MTNQHRSNFRSAVFDETNNECIVPWCETQADDAHHVIERELWNDGGYIPDNGASVCNKHHQYAETNDIPPQAFWMWKNIQEPPLPASIDTMHVDKWGAEFDTPPWKQHRKRIKYQSSRHLLPLYWHDPHATQDERIHKDDTGLQSVESFLDIPLVFTQKLDGGNTMLIKDTENPVRARNGKTADHESYALLKELYWNEGIHETLPEHLQVFGEWLYARHSIHYGCDCEEPCEDTAPRLTELLDEDDPTDDRAYFQVFGVYDMRYDMWLSWPTTELGFPTVPVIEVSDDTDTPRFEKPHAFTQEVFQMAQNIVDNSGEGLVVRSKFPFHYSQFPQRLGKFVRPNHVKTDEHWSKGGVVPNRR
jgi:hypothetical protein